MWFDIYINRIENQIVLGISFASELSNMDQFPYLLKGESVVWTYQSNGNISSPRESNSFTRFSDDDLISVEVNIKKRTISFYKNYTCVHTIKN